MSWKDIVRAVAPTLGVALGGPMGGMAAKAISGALLGKDDGTPSEVEAAMAAATPDDLLKLKDADNAFKTKMSELGVDLEEIAASDRADARQREIKTKDNAPKILSTVIVVGFFTTLYTIAFVDIPEGAEQPVSILLGALTAMLTQVGNYYFGSSAGSKAKTLLLGSKN